MSAMTIQSHEPTNLPAAGWYPDHTAAGVIRYWDGAAWTDHVAAQAPAAVPVYVANQPQYMVTSSKVHTSHTFHLLMTVFTFGLWGVFVWGPMILINAMRREKSHTRIG